MIAFLRSIWKTHVTELRDSVDAESAAYRAAVPPSVVTQRIAIVIFSAALCMMLVRFAGNVDDVKSITKVLDAVGLDSLAQKFQIAMTKSPDKRINQRIWWATARIVGYGVLPLLITKFALKAPLGDFGLKLRGASWKTYLTLLLIVAPFVIAASYGSGFQAKYPYYRLQPGEPLWPRFVSWEILYALNFFGIEYFFRGFLIHGLRRELGHAAVFIPIIPYLTIHFGKPLPEAIGSIITGFVLGTLSLGTRSVWGGVMVHAAVAVGMDVLSVYHQGLL